ncbi:MAG: hypothetical protein AMJ43_03505 [Coxiella sp. DG_40]|nr:MAG: hypothetical protein AMJ43_03505 [Coxiella sp. DG_40]
MNFSSVKVKALEHDPVKMLNQDISLGEFKDYLRRSNQLESFESYLTEQSKLSDENQEWAYKLIMILEGKEDSLNNDPIRAMKLHDKGLDLRRLGRYQEALESYDESLKICPNVATTLCDRGDVLRDLGRYKEALESYNESLLNIWPHDVMILSKPEEVLRNLGHTLHNRGGVLRDLGRYEEALECLKKGLEILSKDAVIFRNRNIIVCCSKYVREVQGLVLRDLGRYEEALECFDKSLVIYYDADVLSNRSIVLRKLNIKEHCCDEKASQSCDTSFRP